MELVQSAYVVYLPQQQKPIVNLNEVLPWRCF
jgi:hypothetical protein